MPRMQMTAVLLSLATLCVPALAQDTNQAVQDSPSITALNFAQGQATLDGQPITVTGAEAPRPLRAGDTVATRSGNADLMMAPGSLLRIGEGAQLQVVAESPDRVEVRLSDGRANVSVNHVPEGTLLLVDMPQGQTQLLKSGLYTFDTPSNTLRVYHGEADAFPGQDPTSAEKPLKVKEGHELVMHGGFRPEKFDEAENVDLLPWVGPQETQAALADGAVSNHGFSSVGYGGYGDGLYGDGFAYGSPYGYYAGIDSPYGWGYPYGFYGYPFFGFGVGYFGGVYGGHYGYGYRGGYPGGARGGYAGGVARGGFAGGGFHGGGFAGGGFHGGGHGR